MPEHNSAAKTANDIKTLKLICIALAMGTALFAAVTVWLTLSGISPGSNIGKAPAGTIPTGLLLLGITGIVGFSQAAAWPFMRSAVIRTASKTWDGPGDVEMRERRLWGNYGTLCIMRGALLEGFGLLGIVTLLIGGVWWGLAAPAIAIVLILATLPSQSGYERFLNDVTRRF